MVASDIAMAGTLLGSAMNARKARFVSDCGALGGVAVWDAFWMTTAGSPAGRWNWKPSGRVSHFLCKAATVRKTHSSTNAPTPNQPTALYFQRALQPAADVFTPASQLVSSLVVIPFCDTAPILGGIYFALDTPDDFSQLQPPILGVVSMVSVLLQQKLGDQADVLQERITQASLSPLATNSRSAERLNNRQPSDRVQLPPRNSCPSGQPLSSSGEGNAVSLQPSSLSFTNKRLNTDAIMKVGAHAIMTAGRRSLPLISSCIGAHTRPCWQPAA